MIWVNMAELISNWLEFLFANLNCIFSYNYPRYNDYRPYNYDYVVYGSQRDYGSQRNYRPQQTYNQQES